jgi:predicted PurR-regulated permease PerM
LALLKAADTGQNFWLILLAAVAVFAIVQVIIDMVVTPKIMGHAMGLNPAILLLSLSVWGALLGFIGLIIALPLTTLLIPYYQRYVTRENEDEPVVPEQPQPSTQNEAVGNTIVAKEAINEEKLPENLAE